MGTTQSKKAGPRISEIAREKKLQFFFGQIRRDAKVLDVGCADGWAEKWARGRGWTDITGLDLMPPADVVGDIREWKNLGLEAHSFDAILAFEVLEHGDFTAPLHDLLRRMAASWPRHRCRTWTGSASWGKPQGSCSAGPARTRI